MPSRDDIPTLVPCPACEGAYLKKKVPKDPRAEPDEFVCAHCTRGSMNEKQVQDWKVFRLRHPTGPTRWIKT